MHPLFHEKLRPLCNLARAIQTQKPSSNHDLPNALEIYRSPWIGGASLPFNLVLEVSDVRTSWNVYFISVFLPLLLTVELEQILTNI